MKLFGWKGAAVPRPALARGFALPGTGTCAPWPQQYEAQLREAVQSNPVAQRAVRLVAEALAGATLLVNAAREDDARTVERLLRVTSGGQGPVEALAIHLQLHGNAYVQMIGDGAGGVAELFALRPDRVSVHVDARGWPVGYIYRAGTTQTHLPTASDGAGANAVRSVIHIRTIHPLDDHYGMGCLSAASGAVAIHNAATRWNKALLDNAARPSGALVHEPGKDGAPLSAAQFQRLREELEAAFAGAGNAGRPMLLDGGLKWQSLSMTPADMDFVGLKAAAARDIALAFGVPPMLLALPGDATYANYREANRALWRQTILPMGTRILNAIAEGLEPVAPGLRISIDRDAVAELSEERSALWARVSGADFLTDAEKRAMLGLPEKKP